METIGEVVARDRRSRDPALRAPTGVNTRYDYYQFITTAQKTGNFFRHFGVGSGTTVAVVSEESGAPLLSLFGASLLGARVRFDPPTAVEDRLLVAPADRIDEYEVGRSGHRIAYGDGESPTGVQGFGEGVWSENPACPIPPDLGRDDPALVSADGEYAHGELVDAADTIRREYGLEPGIEVAIRTPLSAPGTVVAGVLAPLAAGATVVFPDEGDKEVCDVAVATEEAPEPVVIRADEVTIGGPVG